MKQAVQFGAGNIGRGFMGQLFFEAGYKTCFIEAVQDLSKALSVEKSYPLRILDAYSKREVDMRIDNIDALHISEKEKILPVIAKAEVIGTAVGVKYLSSIAPLLAAGLLERKKVRGENVDVYLCENILDAADQLKKYVLDEVSSRDEKEWIEEHVGFVGTTVARMVPVIDPALKENNPLLVVADSYHKLPYNGNAVKAARPPIEGMYPVSNFKAEVERKLFVYNLGHAALAYLGFLKGFTYVHETIADRDSFAIFSAALDESSEALLSLYPDDLDREHHNELRRDIHVRYGNPLIKDTISRVGRDPVRKLQPGDRITGSLLLCLEQGIFPEHIAAVCAAALCYSEPGDPEAVKLQKEIEKMGVERVLQKITEVDPKSEIGMKILHYYKKFKDKK